MQRSPSAASRSNTSFRRPAENHPEAGLGVAYPHPVQEMKHKARQLISIAALKGNLFPVRIPGSQNEGRALRRPRQHIPKPYYVLHGMLTVRINCNYALNLVFPVCQNIIKRIFQRPADYTQGWLLPSGTLCSSPWT